MFEHIHNTLEKIKQGDRRALSKAFTLIESTSVSDHNTILELFAQLKPNNQSKRIAISGVPGAGKSTFINHVVHQLAQKHKVAVLSIDPASERSGGSILGDKTRMQDIANLENVFIRPSSTRGFYGGIAVHTYSSILLCEQAGYEYIFIETVGVGQTEISVQHLCDFFVYLALPKAGDALQGIKKGIMEAIDTVVIHKTDLYDEKVILSTKNMFKESFSFIQSKHKGWTKPIIEHSSVQIDNSTQIISVIKAFFEHLQVSPSHDKIKNRALNVKHLIEHFTKQIWLDKLLANKHYQDQIQRLENSDAKAFYHPVIQAYKIIEALT